MKSRDREAALNVWLPALTPSSFVFNRIDIYIVDPFIVISVAQQQDSRPHCNLTRQSARDPGEPKQTPFTLVAMIRSTVSFTTTLSFAVIFIFVISSTQQVKTLLSSPKLFFIHPALGQARSEVSAQLRRRGTSLIGRTGGSRRVNGAGVPYSLPGNSTTPIDFRSDFKPSPYLPGLAYWRLDNAMPGVTRADRFRGNHRGYQHDYYYGRR